MPSNYFNDQEFRDQNYPINLFEQGEYESCQFSNCDLNSIDLSGCKFIDCIFTECNLSNAVLEDTSFQDVTFKDCKMLGLPFDTCRKFNFGASFECCQLNHSVFYQVDLKKCCFQECQMQGVDLGEADLSQIECKDCDLMDVTFDKTNLFGTDLRGSYNFIIDPDQNSIKKAKFSRDALNGLLVKYDILIE